MLKRASLGLLLATALTAPAWPQQTQVDLTSQSIEDLMNLQVTSVSKEEQKLSRTAAAVFVITPEDIRRSGATNIPDLLRMVPGLDVAQINGNTWAISSRGFNQRFANGLLELVDGRSLYTPMFGGVFWDALDIPLEDVAQIEVIRGPGGSVWGANAVNGVINIITKKAGDTQGATVEAGGGNLDHGFGTVQYGGKAGAQTDYRMYTKYFDQNHMPGLTEPNGGDRWHEFSGGFRIDSAISPKDALTFQGNFYIARESQAQPFLASITSPMLEFVEGNVDLSGGFLQGVWNHVSSARSDTTLQISYQRDARRDILGEVRGTLDAEFQHHFSWGERQNILWGLSYTHSASTSRGSLVISAIPAALTTSLYSAFIQDEFALVPNRLYLTVGTKMEHNHYTSFGVMPSARLAWRVGPNHTLWAAVSRALHTPDELDASDRVNVGGFTGSDGIPVVISSFGNPKSKDAKLIGYEAGYRAMLNKRLSLDFAAYYNHYTDLQTVEPAAPFLETTPPPDHLVLPLINENLMHGETHGLEVFANWKLSQRWTLSPGYAFERVHMHVSPASQDTTSAPTAEGSSPVHSAQLRSHLALPRGLAWDASAYFVDRIANLSIPSITRLDTSVSWRWRERTTFSVVGQNLLHDRHLEYTDTSVASTLVKRSVYAKFAWQF